MKIQFIHSELWILTIGGAFQRANIYNSETISEKVKKDFRNQLFGFVNDIVPNYRKNIGDNTHISNILEISRYSENEFSTILNNNRLNFGVSQKLLNLYLKYLWCLDEIGTPPHFPVDRIIQSKLKVPTLYAWTQITDEKPYLEIINYARKKLENLDYSSLAEMELDLFSRN